MSVSLMSSFNRFRQFFIVKIRRVDSSIGVVFWIERMVHISLSHRVDHSDIDFASVRSVRVELLSPFWLEIFWKGKSRQIDKRYTSGGLTWCVESIGSGISGIRSVATEIMDQCWVEINFFRHSSPLSRPNREIPLVLDRPDSRRPCGAISFRIGALARAQMDSKKHDPKNVDFKNVWKSKSTRFRKSPRFTNFSHRSVATAPNAKIRSPIDSTMSVYPRKVIKSSIGLNSLT